MKAAARCLGLLLGGALACQGREITVFDLPAEVGGAGGSAAGPSGGGGTGDAAGAATEPVAGGGSPGGGSPGGASGSGGQSSPPEGGAGMSAGGTPQGRPCEASADCGPGWRCEKRGCDAAFGVCEPQPKIECPPFADPVCGCDGVTYWNECWLRYFDVTQVFATGECRGTAFTCDVGADCVAPYASCSHLLAPFDLCGHGTGACWVLPPDCDSVPPSGKKWRQCLGPDMPLGPCVNTCQAIDSERTHIPAHRDDPCDF